MEVKAVDRFRYDASKSKGYVRLTATVLTNREAVHRKASGPHLTVHAYFLSGTHRADGLSRGLQRAIRLHKCFLTS